MAGIFSDELSPEVLALAGPASRGYGDRAKGGIADFLRGVGDVVSMPARGLGMLATKTQEALSGVPAAQSRVRLAPGDPGLVDRLTGADVAAPSVPELALEGYRGIAQAAGGTLDARTPTALAEEDEASRRGFKAAHPALARAEAVAEPVADLGLQFATDPALAGLGRLGALGKAGAAAERAIGASFVPGMIESAIEHGRELKRAGDEEGYLSPDALRAGVGGAADLALAGTGAYHGLRGRPTIADAARAVQEEVPLPTPEPARAPAAEPEPAAAPAVDPAELEARARAGAAADELVAQGLPSQRMAAERATVEDAQARQEEQARATADQRAAQVRRTTGLIAPALERMRRPLVERPPAAPAGPIDLSQAPGIERGPKVGMPELSPEERLTSALRGAITTPEAPRLNPAPLEVPPSDLRPLEEVVGENVRRRMRRQGTADNRMLDALEADRAARGLSNVRPKDRTIYDQLTQRERTALAGAGLRRPGDVNYFFHGQTLQDARDYTRPLMERTVLRRTEDQSLPKEAPELEALRKKIDAGAPITQPNVSERPQPNIPPSEPKATNTPVPAGHEDVLQGETTDELRARDQKEVSVITPRLEQEDRGTLKRRLEAYQRMGFTRAAGAVREEIRVRDGLSDSAETPGGDASFDPAAFAERRARYGTEAPPRYAFRARDVGERGIPDANHAQATTSEADARRLAPSRSDTPQEVVRVDLSKLGPDDYELKPGPQGTPWVQFKRPLDEAHVERVGELTDVDRAAADKAEPPVREAVAEAPPAELAQRAGLTPEAAAKGKEDVRRDSFHEFSPEAVAVKKAILEGAAGAGDEAPKAHKFSSTQVNLPPELAGEVKRLGSMVRQEDLAGDGREADPHVTVKYGLHTEDAEQVRRVLAGEPPVRVRLGKTSTFPPSEGSDGAAVLKVDVHSPDLHRLNAKIAGALEHTDSHPDYKPHATVAYVKPEAVSRYVGHRGLEGRSAVLDHVTFSDRSGATHEIALGGGARETGGAATRPVLSSVHESSQAAAGDAAPDTQRALADLRGVEASSVESGRAHYSGLPGSGVRTRGLAITVPEELERHGRVDLRGQRVSSPRDLAVLAQVYRDPRFETFRLFYTKGDQIVAHEAFTTRTPGSVVVFDPGQRNRQLFEMKRRMARLEADGYYVLHNHPSGNPDASPADVNITRELERQIPGFKGHVIIDHTKFGLIAPVGGGPTISPLPANTVDPERYLVPSLPHHALGIPLEGPATLALVAKHLQRPEGFVTLVYADARMVTRAIQDLPVALFTNVTAAADYIRGRTRAFGADNVMAVHGPQDGAAQVAGVELIHRGVLIDSVTPGQTTTPALLGMRAQRGVKMDRRTDGQRRMRVEEAGTAYGAGEAQQEPEAPTPEERAARGAARAIGGPGPVSGKPPDFPVNLDRIGTPDDVKATEGRVVEALQRKLGAARGYRSWEDARAKALTAGITEVDFLRMAKAGPVTDHMVEAGRILREEAGKAAHELVQAAAKLKAEGAPTEERLEADRQADAAIARFNGLAWGTVRAGAEAARALAIHRKLSEGLAPDERFLKRAMQQLPGLNDRSRLDITKAVMAGDMARAVDLARSAMKPSAMSKFLEYWKSGLVSGIPTVGGNFFSNALNETWRTAARAGAGGLDAAASALTGKERQRFAGESVAALASLQTSVPKSMRILWDVLSDPTSDYNLSSDRLEHGVPAIGKGFRWAQKITPGGDVGAAVRTPFRVLKAFDEAAKHIASTNELHAQAYRMARRDAAAGRIPKGADAVSSRMADIVAGVDAHQAAAAAQESGRTLSARESLALKDETSAGLAKAMRAAALKSTFQDEAGAITKGILALRRTSPAWELILPFVKTPSRLLAAGIESSPAGYLGVWKGVREGKYADRGELLDAVVKPTMGTLLGIGAVLAAQDGLITGSGPADPKEQQLKQATGWQPYSFKVGDSYVSYKRLEPFASVLGMAADFIEAGHEERGHLAEKIQTSFIENVANKSYLQGPVNAAEAWSDPQRYGKQFAKNLAGSLVPNIVAKGAAAVDPTLRDTNSLAGPILSRIPGASTLLPEKLSGQGEPIERAGGSGLERFASPFQRSTEKPGADLERAFLDVGFVPSTPPQRLTIRGTHGAKVELSDTERRFLSDLDARVTQRLREVVASPAFRRLDPERQKAYFEDSYRRASRFGEAKLLPVLSRRYRSETAAQSGA